jgi:hypothetical protein
MQHYISIFITYRPTCAFSMAIRGWHKANNGTACRYRFFVTDNAPPPPPPPPPAILIIVVLWQWLYSNIFWPWYKGTIIYIINRLALADEWISLATSYPGSFHYAHCDSYDFVPQSDKTDIASLLIWNLSVCISTVYAYNMLQIYKKYIYTLSIV